MSNCNVCLKRVLMRSNNLTCDICNSSVHVKCLPCVNKNDPRFTKRHKNFFYCSLCLRDILAFNHLEDDEFIETISKSWENRPLVSFDMLDNQGLIFSPFDLNDKFANPLHDVDPDIQFYDKHYTGSLQSCDYYLEEMFNDKIKKCKISNQSFSSLHINIRSTQKKIGIAWKLSWDSRS